MKQQQQHHQQQQQQTRKEAMARNNVIEKFSAKLNVKNMGTL